MISEYHAIGVGRRSVHARAIGRWKYCHYVAYPPQLFDLDADPEETIDLAGDPRYRADARRRRAAPARDPRSRPVDARAKRRQDELLASLGGREAALARGDLGFTPAPGTQAELN